MPSSQSSPSTATSSTSMLNYEADSQLTFKGLAGYVNTKTNRRVHVEAHRGGMGLEPENTIRAFKRAIELKVDSIELDVWLSKDGVPVVVHGENDGNLKKNTSLDSYVGDHDANFITQLDVGMGEKIPTLEEVIKLIKPTPVYLNIELKGTQAELPLKVYELVQKYQYESQCCFSSFNHDFLEVAAALSNGTMELGYLFNRRKNDEIPSYEILFQKGNTINLRSNRVTREVVEEAHRRGFGVQVWFSAQFPEDKGEYERFIDYGVDILCVNNPDALINLLNNA